MGRRTVGLLTPQRLWLVPVVGLLGSVLAWYRLVQEHHGGDEGGSSGSAVSGDKGPQLWWLREKPPAWQRAVSNFTSHGTDSAWLTVVYLSLVATQAFVLRLCWAYRRFWPLHFALFGPAAMANHPQPRHHVATLPYSTHVRAFHNNIIFGTCVLLNLLSIATSVPFFLHAAQDTMVSTWLSHFPNHPA
ncbi:hypothetical protein PTSG_04345 [Salpingoeca rosetta]|uniref:Uncharacterized protein n=1 Tax=Salpingoeca rosetta (strain ATCC 50818 / BSB-021) TaxID=946362 RepID=F2U8A2_SALR5|nr:uncharacterized protein PTSG_04345 [Salpingoeca rosetta]EGD72610.1 hypothetical protein PTSG_04345 [Salpingoeca rosetta]|eukprot:XP_004994433.1 hypothetical protein PTSG_04345 [Salpingoeca rosetta]